MADFFVGPVMEKIIDAGFDYLKDQVRWQTGMKEEQQRLRDLYPKIQAVVFAASQQQIGDENSAFNKWLWQLRDAIDEADDVLDEFEYFKYKEQLAINQEKTKELRCTSFLIEGVCKFCEHARKFFERALKIDPSMKRLEEALHKLVNVSAKVSDFLSVYKIEEKGEQQQQLELYKTRETGSSRTPNYFIGRRDEKKKILQWMRNSSNEDQSHITSSNLYKNISLLSIVGHGGMGKTTLSQHAYDNEMTKFDVKMWVCVSTNFDVKRVIAGMLESHTDSKCDLGTLEGLQKRLKSQVTGKTFLLVLDDIWEDERDTSKWEKVFGPLAVGSLGSKILVTTRMDSVASMFAKVLSNKGHKTLKLEGLEDDECLELLNSQAFATVENPDAHKKSILKQIVKKVLGSPLAAKVIGGVLSDNMNETYWKKILDSDIGSIEESQNILFPILRLSYMFLPKPLQSCFSFCSIFPQDHRFDKDDLIRMWIALNFIQPSSNPREALEDIGERYFDILIKKSFFEMFQYPNGISYYKMHDLLHELAQFVSARECCRVMGDGQLSNWETIRHLSVKTDDLEVLRKIKEFKKLRSLFLSCDMDNHKDCADVLSEIVKASSSIRLLFIDARCQMPEAIGDLIHLRYLKCGTGLGEVTQLPRSICNLYHMYFIIYESWNNVTCDFLPRDMNNLFNLRYAKLPWKKLPKMHFIGELHPLQRLNNFWVKNEAGYRINELKHMNELRRLRIYQLENVKDAEEASSAKFCDKGSLTKLSLHWGDDTGYRNIVHSNLDEEVFDNLKPHNNLKRLTMKAYMGTRSAIWMNDVNSISNLERIKLEGCLGWQILPPFGHLRFLKSLYLRKMPKVRSIDYIPSLEVLHIEDLDALEDWFDAAAANDSLFPCLTELCLRRCPKLQVLPSLPPKLQRLSMNKIRWKGFSWLQDTSNCYEVDITDCGDLPGIFSYYMRTTESGQFIQSDLRICDPSELLVEPLRRITSVIVLTICVNDKLVSFPIETEEWFLQVSSSLRKLIFENVESLQSLPSFLKSFSSLKYLHLSNIPLLKSVPDLPSSLEEIQLSELKSLQHLSSLSNISSLKRLLLEKISLLKSLPVLPPSLEELSIKNLESLQCLPSSLSTFSSLKNLKLSSIPLLKSLPVLPSSLERLSIENLESLECLPSSLPSLKFLELSSIPLLKSLPVLPHSLRVLVIKNLKSLECLSSSLSTTSLCRLRILNVPLLQQLPDLPSSLESLWIIRCHEELKKRYDKISGFDRDKVAHIENV